MSMSRRQFLKIASSGMAAVAVGTAGGYNLFWCAGEAMAATTSLNLSMVAALMEMSDTVQVPVWAFQKQGDPLPRVPGIAIFSVEGDEIQISITNTLTVRHAFFIPGVVNSGDILPGQTVTVTFTAPTAGTYMYYDNTNAPMNRVMGLHGPLVVLPRIPFTPYTNPPSNMLNLFNDLGPTDHFPGSPWDPDRNWFWFLNSFDPGKNLAAAASPAMAASNFTNGYLSQYFTISGKSGFFASHDPKIRLEGYVGQPCLVRCMNAGLITHSYHLHGNHAYLLADNDFDRGDTAVSNNIRMLDVWYLAPLQGKDMLVPYIQPPDIPKKAWPPKQENFPLDYPMHCHTEPSQTAAGGNYPSGLLTHFIIKGPLQPTVNAVVQVTRAELRLRFGKVSIAGVSSQAAGTVLEVRTGASSTGAIIGTTTVKSGGKWSFSGRALKALVSRSFSVTTQGGGPQRLDIRPVVR